MQVLAQLQRMMDTQDDVALLKRASTMMTALQAAEQVPAGPSEADRLLVLCWLAPMHTQLSCRGWFLALGNVNEDVRRWCRGAGGWLRP